MSTPEIKQRQRKQKRIGRAQERRRKAVTASPVLVEAIADILARMTPAERNLVRKRQREIQDELFREELRKK